jgi:hypothetical protein
MKGELPIPAMHHSGYRPGNHEGKLTPLLSMNLT